MVPATGDGDRGTPATDEKEGQMSHREALKRDSTSVARHILTDVMAKNLSGLAQQIAYNILFALAPLLIFIVALTGWVTQVVNSDQPNPAAPVLRWMRDTMPPEAAAFLAEPVNTALTTQPGFLLSFGAVVALWGIRGAMSAVIMGLNAAYDIEPGAHSWLRGTLRTVALTIGVGLATAVAIVVFVLGTDLGTQIADAIGIGEAWATVSEWLRWPVIAAMVTLAVALIHRIGPDLDVPLAWLLPGAVFSVVAMLTATSLLSIYFSLSGGYSKAYGAFGAVLAFVFWLYVMGLVLLVGGVINNALLRELPAAPAGNDARRPRLPST